MPRERLVQDIQPKRRSLREALPLSEKKPEPRKAGKSAHRHHAPEPPRTQAPQSGGGSLLWPIVILAIGFLAFTVLDSMGGVTLTISPHTENVSLEAQAFSASMHGAGVQFERMKMEDSLSVTLPASGTEDVETRASGRAVIYNAYSASPQRLLIETRLEAPDGKIYKTTAATTVPGYTRNGTEIVPGSVEVEIRADQPGSSYNKGLTDFTIPGFRGTDKYSKFYARSKTEIEGGAQGVMGVVPADQKDAAIAKLKNDLRTELLRQARLELPESFVLFDDAAFFSSETSAETAPDGTFVEFTEQGSLEAFILDRASLAEAVRSTAAGTRMEGPVSIPLPESLSFAIANRTSLDPSAAETFSFTLDGDASLVATVDEAALKEALAGKRKKQAPSIFAEYPSIDSAEVVIRPFWKASMPEDEGKIRVLYREL